MAISMLSAAIAVAWLQYGSTFRGDPGGTLLVCELSGLLAVILSFVLGLAILHSLQFLIQNPGSIFSRNLAVTGVALATSAANARMHWKWHAQLEQPGATSRRPDSARSISLKEVFLLLLAIAFVLGVASSGVRLGWHDSNLF